MSYYVEYSKEFLKDLKKIQKGNPSKINQIKKIIQMIIENPFNLKLDIKKLRGFSNIYRYKVGRNYRILIQIIIIEKKIIFLKISSRENFYSNI
jgi:addiction module RelE/StbE family toxin